MGLDATADMVTRSLKMERNVKVCGNLANALPY